MSKNGTNEKLDKMNILSDEMIIALFHDHATMLENYWVSALRPVIKALGPNPFDTPENISETRVFEMLKEPTKNLYNALNESILGKSFNIGEQSTKNLFNAISKLNEFLEDRPHKSLWFPTLRLVSRKLIENLNDNFFEKIFDPLQIEEIISLAKEIERLVCLYDLSKVEIRLLELKNDASYLRDIISSKISGDYELEQLNFSELLWYSYENFKPLADKKGVKIEFKNTPPDVMVCVNRRDMQRAINNILSNAIKYSWTLSKKNWSWVNIFSGIEDDFVYLKFENWGVPLENHELNKGDIYEFGYRGRFSNDQKRIGSQKRTGTGIGLWDTYQTFIKHDGSITLESFPAKKASKTADYDAPYITKVTLKLPIMSPL